VCGVFDTDAGHRDTPHLIRGASMLTKIGKINTNTQTHNSYPTNIKHLPKNNTKKKIPINCYPQRKPKTIFNQTRYQSIFINWQYTTNKRSREKENLFNNLRWVKRNYLKSQQNNLSSCAFLNRNKPCLRV